MGAGAGVGVDVDVGVTVGTGVAVGVAVGTGVIVEVGATVGVGVAKTALITLELSIKITWAARGPRMSSSQWSNIHLVSSDDRAVRLIWSLHSTEVALPLVSVVEPPNST